MNSVTIGMGCVILAVAMSGCASWRVVKTTNPSPLVGQRRLAVLPLDWTRTTIDGMRIGKWGRENDGENRRDWPEDMRLATAQYKNALIRGSSGPFVLPTPPA